MPPWLPGPGELRRPRGHQGGTLALRQHLAQATVHASSSLLLRLLVLLVVVLVLVLVLAEVHPSRWLGLGRT